MSKSKRVKLNQQKRPADSPLPGGPGMHIGGTIKKLLKQKEMSVATFAKLLGVNPKNAHIMLRKKYLHASRLIQISEVLEHDVVRYLYPSRELWPGSPELLKRIEELEEEKKQLREDIKQLKERLALIEEMNELLKKKG